jgi:protein phosphatase
MVMTLNIHAASHKGCVRENNEDMVLASHTFVRDDSFADNVLMAGRDRYLAALADGMGGHQGGEVASSDVLHNLDYFFGDIPKGLSVSDYNEAIFEWLNSINNIIDSKGRSDQRFVGMGTTLVAFAYYNKHFYWMNCGDSRFYRMHGSALTQVSTDHSLSNLVGSDEHSNIITNCIGGGCKMSYIDMVQYTPDIVSGDVLLLCSDGLTDMLTDIEILDLLEKGADAMKLCKAAEVAGGFDNVSACVIKVV